MVFSRLPARVEIKQRTSVIMGSREALQTKTREEGETKGGDKKLTAARTQHSEYTNTHTQNLLKLEWKSYYVIGGVLVKFRYCKHPFSFLKKILARWEKRTFLTH